MASIKDKYLENAQKFIIKGQIDKASRELEQALSVDPSDIKVRQRLAELYVRMNRTDEAKNEYEKIGRSYSESGFYLKAIAAYKQVQKLAPEILKTSNTLAELNVKHGLIGNALSEFSILVNSYLKLANYQSAIEILQRMLEIDPENPNTMLKLAETRLASGDQEQAYKNYETLAAHLSANQEIDAFNSLCERMKTLFPDKGFSPTNFVRLKLEKNDINGALAELKEILSSTPDSLEAWNLLSEAFRMQGDKRQYYNSLSRIIQRFPDQFKAREDIISLSINDGDMDTALQLLEEQRSDLFRLGRAEPLENFYKAVQNSSTLDTRPMEGLKWLYKQTGDIAGLEEVNSLLSSLAPQEMPEEEFVEPDILDEQEEYIHEIEPLEEDEDPALQEIEIPSTPLAIAPVEAASVDSDWEEDIDLGFDDESEITPETNILETSEQEFSDIPEFDHTFGDDLAIEESGIVSFETGEPDSVELYETDCIDILNEKVILTIENPLPASAFILEENLSENSDTEPFNILVGVDEHDLAEDIEETIEEMIGDSIDSPYKDFSNIGNDDNLNSDEEKVPEYSLEAIDLETSDDENSVTGALEALLNEASESAAFDASLEDEHSYDLDVETEEEIPSLQKPEVSIFTGNETFDWEFSDNKSTDRYNSTTLDNTQDLKIEEPADFLLPDFNSNDLDDFAESLFGDETASKSHDTDKTDALSLDSLISAFKKGVDEQVEESDTETHFNLGIAYKEMGLYDEAISEFRLVAKDPVRSADCAALEGTCLKDAGRIEEAEAAFKKGLLLTALSGEALLNLKYELASLYELCNRIHEAETYYSEILKVLPNFRDVAERLRNISGEEDLLDMETLDIEEE